jgi:hypothetical protein
MKKSLLTLIVLAIAIILWVVLADRNDVVPPVAQEASDESDPIILSLFEDVDVNAQLLRPFSAEEGKKIFKGIEFTLTPSPNPPLAGKETVLIYNLRIDGKPATDMEKHLGSYGSSTAIEINSFEKVGIDIIRKVTPHGTLEFSAVFPKRGDYLVFTQFKRGGEIITTDFDVSVR